MILVFGSLNIDLVTRVPVIPGPGRTVLAPSYATHFGGKGANQAVAAARIAGAGKVLMAGRVGKDGSATRRSRISRATASNGLIVRAEEPTGCAFITVDGSGENAITVASGANIAARAADVPAQHLTADTVLVLQMEGPFAEALEVARRTRAASGRVVWNLAPGAGADDTRDGPRYAGGDGLSRHQRTRGARCRHSTRFKAAGFRSRRRASRQDRPGHLRGTAGAQGAFAFAPDGTRARAPTPDITPVDTTGAGDTFVGAFACMIAENLPLPKALAVGCEAAALKCLKPGAQDGMPKRGAISALRRG